MSLHLTHWKILVHRNYSCWTYINISQLMTYYPLGGWGQFADVTDLGFERHSPGKNTDWLQASWTTYAIGLDQSLWQNCRLLDLYVNHTFPHKAQLFHLIQISKLILALFFHILHSYICSVTCSIRFHPDITGVYMNMVDEGIASVFWCHEPWSLLLLANKLQVVESNWNGSKSHQC